MDIFGKAVSLALITVLLGLSIEKREFSVLLSMVACTIISFIAMAFLKPIVSFLWELSSLGNFENDSIKILLKAAGIAIISELSMWICNDAGNSSLGKALQLLGSVSILYISLPMYKSLLTLIQGILGKT